MVVEELAGEGDGIVVRARTPLGAAAYQGRGLQHPPQPPNAPNAHTSEATEIQHQLSGADGLEHQYFREPRPPRSGPGSGIGRHRLCRARPVKESHTLDHPPAQHGAHGSPHPYLRDEHRQAALTLLFVARRTPSARGAFATDGTGLAAKLFTVWESPPLVFSSKGMRQAQRVFVQTGSHTGVPRTLLDRHGQDVAPVR